MTTAVRRACRATSACLLLSAVLLALAAPSTSRAADCVFAAANGSDGASSTTPGQPGGDGTDGQSAVTVLCNAPDPVNSGQATGGDGGRGGTGADGADGGDGGRGGDAATETQVSGTAATALEASATASGGDGGYAGAGGDGGAPGISGDGGNASASASAVGSGATFVEAEAFAYAGDGANARAGSPATTGGTATATAHAESDSSRARAAIVVAAGRSSSEGIDVAVDGGVTGSSPELLTLSIGATAGRGRQGGDVTVSGDYVNPGAGSLEFLARLSGGGNSVAGEGGTASAGPISLSTADPGRGVLGFIQAEGGSGSGDATLVDVFSTTNHGDIEFSQIAVSGTGNNGSARSELTTSVDATSIEGRTTAQGGGHALGVALADITNLGGDAIAEATANAGGERRATARAVSQGGDGNATATADTSGRFINTSSSETAEAHAIASGDGNAIADALTRDGSISAHAFGSAPGAGNVTVSAQGEIASAWGESATGDVSVVAQGQVATAHGESGTGDVDVTAAYGYIGGGTRDFRNAATGSTTGNLRLSQRAQSGNGPILIALTPESTNAASLELDILAEGRGTSTLSGHVLLGDVHGISTTGADVNVQVDATGGRAVQPGQAAGQVLQYDLTPEGAYLPSTIVATSNGGAVRAQTRFATGRAAADLRGLDLTQENLALVETTGALEVDQAAIAGGGGSASGSGPGGDGGNGTSILTRHDDRSSLTLASRAGGGSSGGSGADGGTAHAIADGSNSGGTARVLGEARGGLASSSGAPATAGRGGDALLELTAATSGDGHSVEVGMGDAATTGAFGGDGDDRNTTDASVRRSHGGEATSRSVGTALGDSLVAVSDRATGGAGGGATTSNRAGFGGDGGRGFSTATAQGAGASLVSARAEAFGGIATAGPEMRGNGGDAFSDATATGLGVVESSAQAVGGDGGRGGNARAQARAEGTSGFAEALAATSGVGEGFGASGRIDVGSVALAGAETGYRLALPELATSQDVAAGVFLTARPLAPGIARATAGNAAVASEVSGDSGVAFLGQFAAASPTGTHTTASSFDLQLDELGQRESVAFGVFELDAVGDGFSELRFRLERSGAPVVPEQVFTSLAAAEAFFADTVFDVGLLEAGASLLVVFEADQGAGEQVSLSFALTSLPEPGTGLLLVVGLVLSRGRRRSAR